MRALYFTRATAPSGEGPLYHHIGLYAYRRRALDRFVALPPSPLEKRERLEQLRAVEDGMRIDIILVDDVPLGVDTPHDLERARAILAVPRRSLTSMSVIISYQGEPGAFSSQAALQVFPDCELLPCATFEDALAAVSDGTARYGMIPIDNSIAGRVADIHHLLPNSGLHVIGEHFLPIRFHLMAAQGRDARDAEDGAEPYPRARPVPQDDPQARPQGRGRGRYGRLGPAGRGSGRSEPRRDRAADLPPRSTASTS